ncbi:MAG: diaminopimelate epimerase [Alphaproteobacteria bacterium]|nr:diaminopimelate epimerase [Alphaproteobacteria bacterium]
MKFPFIKMNGAGNDFVVLDARKNPEILNFEQVRAIARRDNAVTQGCDQVIMLEPSSEADVFMRIYNANGGEVDACGNATRCVADLLEKELGRLPVTIQTNVGILRGIKKAVQAGREYTLVDMGLPRLLWNEIPLAIKADTLRLPVATGLAGASEACCVSMGNPHAIFFMEQLPADEDVARVGKAMEDDQNLFPEGVNVTFAKIHPTLAGSAAAAIEAKVWERGAGMTKACGTAACATLVAASRLGLIGDIRKAGVGFPGGILQVSWQGDDHVLLGGEIIREFDGIINV